MSEHKNNFPEFYITAPQPCPYLPGRMERKLFTHLSQDKPEFLVDNLLKGGFRRSQNIAYMPYCDNCSACVSVRIVVDEFIPSKSLRRIWKRNLDIEPKRINASPTSEQYSLFRDYIDNRHADGGMSDMSVLDYTVMVEDSSVDTYLTEYRRRDITNQRSPDQLEPLLGVSLCDRLSDGISMVYSFFNPEDSERSLGTYMIIEQVEYARSLGLPYVYLGYWISGAPKMEYKTRFQPQEQLTPNGWVQL